MPELIPVSEIKQDASTQPRLKMDMNIIEEYSESMKGGAKFPPLVVFKVEDHHILVDGYHRLWAAQNAKIKKILCEVHEGTMRDAILFASGVNSTHGLRRTNEDKRRAVERLLADSEWGKWSNNKISEICNVSDTFVGKCRGNSTNVCRDPEIEPPKARIFATKKGTISKINTENIGKKSIPNEGRIPSKTTEFPEHVPPAECTVPLKGDPDAPCIKPLGAVLEKHVNPGADVTTTPAGMIINDTYREKPAWTPATCRTGPCPDGKSHNTQDKVRGLCCDLTGQPVNQIGACAYLERQKKAGGFTTAAGNPSSIKVLQELGGVKIVKTPLTEVEAVDIATTFIQRSGFFTTKEQEQIDELIQAQYEGIRSRSDFLKKAGNWFLAQAEGE